MADSAREAYQRAEMQLFSLYLHLGLPQPEGDIEVWEDGEVWRYKLEVEKVGG